MGIWNRTTEEVFFLFRKEESVLITKRPNQPRNAIAAVPSTGATEMHLLSSNLF